MKTFFYASVIIGLLIIVSCNNSSDKISKETDTIKMMNNTMPKKDMQADSGMTMVTPTFTSLDAKLSVDLKTIVDHYLHIKNALVNNDGSDAASGGNEMEAAISKVDKSLLTADQKKVYDGVADDLKEHAEHIGANKDKIDHQREHFSMMSEDVYDLVKAFGGGQILYHDHCPMADGGKGAMWLSEMKEVKNPYFGGKMNSCVHVMEEIK